MSEEKVDIRVAELLVRWMGGENLREAVRELTLMVDEESVKSYGEGYRFAKEESSRISEASEVLV